MGNIASGIISQDSGDRKPEDKGDSSKPGDKGDDSKPGDKGNDSKQGNKGDNSKAGDVEGTAESSPELPDIIDPTVAADFVRSQREPLLNLISHCLLSLANSLLAKSIISRDVYKKACNTHLEESERGGALLDCVETRVRLKASCFATFIDILNSEPFLSDLAEELLQSYCTLSKCPATISSAISHNFAAYLKGVYRNSPISIDNKWPPTPSKSYINLATVKHGCKCRDGFIGITLCGNIKEVLKSRKEISIDEILVPDKEDVAYLKLILVEGAPGIGKSTLAWELCRRWEQGHMEKYSLTVLLRLREKEVQEIRSIAQLFCSYQNEDRDFLIKEISSSNGKGVLFILDGFDELPTTLQKEGCLVNLIRGTFLPECTVLVTSRPSATAELLTICRPQIQKHIEVLGFTQKSVEEYATSIFSSEPERLQKFKAFISASDNPAINSLMYIPLNAAIIVEIYRDSKSDHLLPCTLTQVYTQLCLTILNRYFQSNQPSVKVNEFQDLPGHLYLEFLKLSKVAFDGMRKQEVIFHTLPSDLVHFGFLDSVTSLYGGGRVSYNFLHLTLQEFFAACHISQLSGDARLELLREHCSDERWDVVWRFVAGLTELKFFEGHFSDLFVYKNNGVTVKPLFIQCLFEANLKTKLLFELKYVEVDFLNFKTPPPLDWYALGCCIANLTSEVSWNIRIGGYYTDNLVNGLKTCNSSTVSNNINRLYFDAHINTMSCEGYPAAKSRPKFNILEEFPLSGITDLTLSEWTITSDLLARLLPSMISLKRLSFPLCTFTVDSKILSQSSVTSLDIRCSKLTEPFVLQPLIDPLTGTLEELGIGDYYFDDITQRNSFAAFHPRGTMFSTFSLLDMACAPSSLKSLKLGLPRQISSLQTNTCLTKLEIFPLYRINLEVIVGLLEHNKTLEHFTLGDFKLPRDINALKDIVETLEGNCSLRSVRIWIYMENCDRNHFSDYVKATYPEINNHRIEYLRKIHVII